MAAFLLLPIGLMRLQTSEALTSFHNRSLQSWPSLMADRRNPAIYFTRANGWLSDRLFPTMVVNRLKNELAYRLLGQSPAANIAIGSGLTLLAGGIAERPDDLVSASCDMAATPASLARLTAALGRIAAFGRQRGYPVDVLMVPTLPVLYGDRLPRSISPALRDACAKSFARGGPVSGFKAPEGIGFVFPFAALKDRRDDPALYPNGNYHATGLSVRLATNAYLRSIGMPELGTSLALTEAPSEALQGRGIEVPFPVYDAGDSGAVPDDALAGALTDIAKPYRDDPLQAFSVYTNPAASIRQSVLVLSDSFGTNQATDLAAAFRTVAQMQAPHRDIARMIDRIHDVLPFDRLLFVVNDTNSTRLSEVGERLSAGDGR